MQFSIGNMRLLVKCEQGQKPRAGTPLKTQN